jgi:hypothetical protein
MLTRMRTWIESLSPYVPSERPGSGKSLHLLTQTTNWRFALVPDLLEARPHPLSIVQSGPVFVKPNLPYTYTWYMYYGTDSSILESIRRRTNRIVGQVAGIQGMIEEDRYCVDILNQISAVRPASMHSELSCSAAIFKPASLAGSPRIPRRNRCRHPNL